MAITKKRKTVSISDIPEVAAFEEAKEKLERLKAAYEDVLEQFKPVVEDYNDRLEAAAKAVAAQGVNCGDFTVMSTAVAYDADKLFEAKGQNNFLKVGGTIETKRVLSVDKAKIEASIANGSIEPDVAQEITKTTNRYNKPKPVVLP